MKKLKTDILPFSEGKSVYKTIEDCPIWNWMKIQETGNLTYLGSGTNEELEEIFLSMQDEIFEKFGISQNYQDYLMLLKQKAVILEQLTEKFDPFLKLDLEVINDDIKTLTTNGTRQDFDEVIIIIEKFMSFQLDPKKVSVKKYYSYLKTIEKHGKAD